MNALAQIPDAINRHRRLLANGFKPLPALGKAVKMTEWQIGLIDEKRIGEFLADHPNHTNIGLRCGSLVGVDIDVTNLADAAELEKAAEKVLGDTAFRRRGKKGVMLSYRNEDPLLKITVATGNGAKIEFLGVGQQFIAFGIHPDTGKAYEWDDAIANPFETPFNELPEVTPDQIKQCAAELANRFEELGYNDVRITGSGLPRERKLPFASAGEPISSEIVEDMLRCIPPDCARPEWLTVAGALQTAPFDNPDFDPLELFVGWSRGDLHDFRPRNFVDASDCIALWEYDADRIERGEYVPRIGALIERAQEGGYRGPTSSGEAAARQKSAGAFSRYMESAAAEGLKERTGARAIVLRDETTQDAAKAPEMLVDGLLPRNGTAGWGGRYEAGKGLVVIDLGLSVATGKPFLNKFPVKRTGSVVYLTTEGLAGIETLRRPAWRIARGIPDNCKIPFYTFREVPTVLSGKDGIEPFYDAIRKLHIGPALVIIDPLAAAMLGLKQNDNDDATRYDKELARPLADALNCLVLTVCHTGKDGDKGLRGASAFGADFDAVWLQERSPRDEEPPRVKIWKEKVKDFEPMPAFGAIGEMVFIERIGKSCPVMNWTPPEVGQEIDRRTMKVRRTVELRTEVEAALTLLGAYPGGSNEWNETEARGGKPTKEVAEAILRARDERAPTKAEIDVLVATLNRDTRRSKKDTTRAAPLEHYVVSRLPQTMWALASVPEAPAETDDGEEF